LLKEVQNIVLIGAGNVATQLGLAIQKTSRKIVHVYSRTEASAMNLAGILKTEFTCYPEDINPEADLYILSVTDDAVSEIVGKLNLGRQLVVHTSGSLPMDILRKSSENVGVLYPLQTFSKSRSVDFNTVPLCIEANSKDNLHLLEHFAKKLSQKVVEVDSEKRKILHLAAVFACNFSNFMYSIAGQVLADKGLNFELLRPLILETAWKVQELKPDDAQTGPASRGDKMILRKHDELLREYPEYREIYKKLSEAIWRSKSKWEIYE
jgi:predicted short-subunit dehydrogenase-like oxidoreductase (DUF2520 family)